MKTGYAIMKPEVNTQWRSALHPQTLMNRGKWRVKAFRITFSLSDSLPLTRLQPPVLIWLYGLLQISFCHISSSWAKLPFGLRIVPVVFPNNYLPYFLSIYLQANVKHKKDKCKKSAIRFIRADSWFHLQSKMRGPFCSSCSSCQNLWIKHFDILLVLRINVVILL